MPQVVTAGQMNEITAQINLLILAVIGFGILVIGVFGATMKWYIPSRFRQQTNERELQLKEMEERINNKNAADKVDIARDAMLPQLIENNQQLVQAVLKMGNAFNDTTIRRIEQDVTNNQTLLAHSKAVVSVTERMEEVVQTLDTQVINLQQIRDASKESREFSELAANAARETLLLVKRQLTSAIEEVKSDTGEIKPIAADSPVIPLDKPDLLEASGQ